MRSAERTIERATELGIEAKRVDEASEKLRQAYEIASAAKNLKDAIDKVPDVLELNRAVLRARKFGRGVKWALFWFAYLPSRSFATHS